MKPKRMGRRWHRHRIRVGMSKDGGVKETGSIHMEVWGYRRSERRLKRRQTCGATLSALDSTKRESHPAGDRMAGEAGCEEAEPA